MDDSSLFLRKLHFLNILFYSRNTRIAHLTIWIDYTLQLYSVKQSYGNIFCGDVVSDSINNTSMDKNNILYYYYVDFNSLLLYENAYKHNSRTKTQFYEYLVVMCCISLNMHIFHS